MRLPSTTDCGLLEDFPPSNSRLRKLSFSFGSTLLLIESFPPHDWLVLVDFVVLAGLVGACSRESFLILGPIPHDLFVLIHPLLCRSALLLR